jgi:thioredoxin-dependent peroxiredoxin
VHHAPAPRPGLAFLVTPTQISGVNRRALLISLLLAGLSCAHANEPLLPVGSPAPEVVGTDATGTTFNLSAQKGRYAIVYFYPKDDSRGCTKEACAFRDVFDQFVAAGVMIFGVSRDPAPSHEAFLKKYALPFPLVPDPSGAVQKAYRVPSLFPGIAARVTFLVGPDGKIARVFPDVDPGVHAREVLDVIASLKGGT